MQLLLLYSDWFAFTDLAPPLLVDRESFMCTRNTYRDLLTDG